MKDHDLKTVRIKIVGLVQGIGYRPYVKRLADKLGIAGEVLNNGGAVSIMAQASSFVLQQFLEELQTRPPELCDIVHMEVQWLEDDRRFAGFTIVESQNDQAGALMLPPDLPVCNQCLKELRDSTNRRFQHPFISCTQCGPRYSIIKAIPYDRPNTAMESFALCEPCSDEYKGFENRRLHAQTIACHDCGPELEYITQSFRAEAAKALKHACDSLQSGHILAVKGTGGYHFVCDPYSDEAVLSLRSLKHRELKPFAVCFPNMDGIKAYCEVSSEEEAFLNSKSRPIALLKPHDCTSKAFSQYVTQDSRFIGAFLAYTPILHLITDAIGPIVATSANLTDEPILYQDDALVKLLDTGLNGVLCHDREILVGQDDSIGWVVNQKPSLIRRARGYVPMPLYISTIDEKLAHACVLATGGQLKSTFCFQKGPYGYLSQFFGDLDNNECFERYKENLEHMKRLFNFNPQLVSTDLHPDYRTTSFAETMGLEVIKVQHHHAHVAAIMAEYGLGGPVLGVAFDGTGLGTDGAIWGGEFLIANGSGFTRAGHLDYVPLVSGDASVKDASRTALCYMHHYGLSPYITDSRYPILQAALTKGIHTHASSSMGRLFDGVSSMLGICHESRYEAQAAILLENAAYRAIKTAQEPVYEDFEIQRASDRFILSPAKLISFMLEARKRSIPTEALALGFHVAVSRGIVALCKEIHKLYGMMDVVLSGGVFQNRILLEMLLDSFQKQGIKAYAPQSVPVNDSGISLGQAYVGMMHLRERTGLIKQS